ncbi:MAG: polysaccharide biosynthesis C-terminal domain-containing protein [Thermoplasmata archaeon]|nr:polysaccharide biosynthesis C-terminal domain-containing protein [Thermoplasmata archaeon]
MGSENPAASPLPAKPAIPTQKLSLTLSSSAVLAAALAIQIIGFVGNLFLYRNIGLTGEGRLLIGTAQFFLLIGSSINGVGDLRLGTAYTYFIARGKPATDNTLVYLTVRMMMVGAASVIIFVIAPIPIAGHQLATGNSHIMSLGLFVLLPIAWSFSTVYNQYYIGAGDSLRAQYPSLIEAIARLPALFIVAYYVPAGDALEGITFAYVAGALCSTVYTIPAVVALRGKFRWGEAFRLYKFAWPLMASLMLNYLVTNMVPIIVNAGLGAGRLTIFLAANGYRVLVLALPLAVTTPLFPYLAGLHRQEKYESVRRVTWHALRYSAMMLVPGVVALVTYRYQFLNDLANHNYAVPGALPLAILVVGALPLALSQIIQTSINAIGRQRLELYITSTSVVVLVAAILLLMPPWGIFPAQDGLVAGAVAVLASSVAALCLNTYFMETLIRVHINPLSIARITASAVGTFASFSFLNHSNLFPVNSTLELLAAILIGFTVYFFILAGTGELTSNDVAQIGASVGLPRRLCDALERLCWNKSSPDLLPVDLARAPGLRSTEFPETFTGTTEMPSFGPLESEPEDESSKKLP